MSVVMAHIVKFLATLLCCLTVVFSSETSDSGYNEIIQFILNSYNENPDTQHAYNSVKILNKHKKNDTESLYLLQLEIALRCNNSSNCIPSSLICEVGFRENVSSNTKEVLTDRAKCAKKEFEPIFPSSGHGFKEENVTNEIRSIAAFAIQQAQNNNGDKRNVIDIMSVKRQVVGNATTMYLTLKVTKTEKEDAVQIEVCEAEMNQTNEMAWESNLICFPLNDLAANAPINTEDITTVAERAADEMDSLSFSEFTLKLVEVLNAESAVTPGSEGTVTHLELRLAPTLCLKNVDIENDSYGLYGGRICPENLSNKRIICSVVSWDRPWVEDTLYSEPTCHEDRSRERIQQTQTTTETVQHDSPVVMMNDQMEPENEEIFVPAVEHHSIPVVEELDPIVEQMLPHVEESLTPVVEEPVIVKHTYCTGCPVDLDVSNPALDEFVEQALAAIDDTSDVQLMHKATRIVKAQKQIVDGVKYIIQLEVVGTTCLKGSEQDRSACESNDTENKICIVEFLEKPWIDSSREIVSNNCTRYKNDLENEIEPHFVPNSHSARQEIFDYLDAMDESDPTIGEDGHSYGKDGLYQPGSEPEVHPVERDAEKIDVKNPEREENRSHKLKMNDKNENENSAAVNDDDQSSESEENQELSKERNLDESNEDSSNERKEDNIDQIAAYITGENRSRRESSMKPDDGTLKDFGDAEKELVDKLAQIAVNTLDEIDEDDKKRVVLEILSAKKQIMNGILYHLHLRIVSTSCSENGESEPDCVNNQLSPVKICKVQLHSSFATNSQFDAKVVKSECAAETEIPSEKKLRKRRNVNIVTGGISPANLDDPYIMQMANFGVSELDRGTNSLYRQCIVRLISASKQVVAGYNIYLTMELGDSIHRKGENAEAAVNSTCELNENAEIKVCDIVIWHRPWIENSQRVTSYNCSDAARTENELPINRRKRRSLVGGPISANTSDPYIQELAHTGLMEVNRRSNALYSQQIVRIIEATKQVVAGVKVGITMELGYTTCRKGSSRNSECQLKENSNNQICYVQIWDRPWLSDRRVLNVSCSPVITTVNEVTSHKEKRHLHVGGSFPVKSDDPYILEMAKTALAEFDKMSNGLYRQKIIRIIEAQKQIVEGTLVKLTLEVGFTKCRKGHKADLETCELKGDTSNQICYIELWDRPWLNKRQVRNASCNPHRQNRLKRKSIKKDELFGEFQVFMEKYDKKYSTSAEYKRRFHIFRANLKKIDLLQKFEQGTARYGATQFADLSAKEFKKYHLGLNRNLKDDNHIPLKEAIIPNVELPKEFDWRHYNVVTEVKNQGSCGSCWAFSVTGNIEGQWAINKGKLLSLSEQELVDCDTLDDGCNGGLPDNAYRAIEKLGGLETESDYPYEGEDEKCHFDKSEVKVTIQGSVNITKNETKIAQWLYKNGPVSIGINANAMQFYVGGISHPWKFLCDDQNLDHGVLIVGFGVHTYPMFHKVLPYWIIKNSWGKSWGEQGYYRVYRGDGTCGVNQMVTSAIVG